MTASAAMAAPDREFAPRLYLWIWGAMLVVLGVGSLLIHPDFGTGHDVTAEHLFGVFETNGWHGLAGLSLGVLSIWSAWRRWQVVAIAAVVAVVGGIVPALVFIVSGDDSAALELIPVDVADAVTLHLLPGLVGLAGIAVARRRPAAATAASA